jgi:hypothetical protein
MSPPLVSLPLGPCTTTNTDDDLLVHWRKVDAPFLSHPPAGMDLTGWRDPFILGDQIPHLESSLSAGNGTPFSFSSPVDSSPVKKQHRMLMGSGIRGGGGTALVYKSSDLLGGWELEGTLAEGEVGDGTGAVWECPVLVPLPVDEEDGCDYDGSEYRGGEGSGLHLSGCLLQSKKKGRLTQRIPWPLQLRTALGARMAAAAPRNPSNLILGVKAMLRASQV